MPFRKKTLRGMPFTTRRVARILSELESSILKLKNLLPNIQAMEAWDLAEKKRQARLLLKDEAVRKLVESGEVVE